MRWQGRVKLPFNRKATPPESLPGRATICLNQLGVRRTVK